MMVEDDQEADMEGEREVDAFLAKGQAWQHMLTKIYLM